MALIQCGQCSQLSKDDNGTCTHCGASLSRHKSEVHRHDGVVAERENAPPIPPPQPKPQQYKATFRDIEPPPPPRLIPDRSPLNVALLLAGAALLVLGVFSPVLKAAGQTSLIAYSPSVAGITVLCAVLALGYLLRVNASFSMVAGVTALSTNAGTFTYLMSRIDTVKGSLAGDNLGLIGDAVARNIQPEWGWAPLFVGAGLLVLPALMEAFDGRNSRDKQIYLGVIAVPVVLCVALGLGAGAWQDAASERQSKETATVREAAKENAVLNVKRMIEEASDGRTVSLLSTEADYMASGVEVSTTYMAGLRTGRLTAQCDRAGDNCWVMSQD